MRKAKHILLFLLLLVFYAGEIYAQYKPEQELSKKEKELFEVSLEAFSSENYIQSYQGFSQLLSLYPREPVFNFLYGASMIKQNYEIKKAFDYLEFAVGKGIPEANFYIGLGYHFLYDFDKAINFYNEFKATTKSKVWEEYNIDKYISQSENGKDLIRYAYELQVISNRQTAIKNFYYSYDLKNFGGEIIVKTERFKGKADKRIDETDLMYISNTNNIVLMSSYGESRKNSLDIYISYKTASGWSDPQKISETINTPFDEAYPFITEDGKTLYFSSKGHNSIGGYDIFRSFYNATNNTWSTPENLDFPINTPYDDIMYASDRFGETAFFASTRESKTNQIGVYRILLEQEQLTRQIVSIEDVYHHASLSINPTAMAELTKRQEVRVNTIIDTTNLRTETIANIDSSSNIDDLFSQSFKSIEKHKSTAQELYEYANAAHTICQTHLQEIKDLNKELSSLKNKNDEKSVARRNDLNNQIIEKSTIAGEMYDLAKFYSDNAKQLNSLSDYYSGELEMLSNLPRNEKSLPEQIEKISREIKNINTPSPKEDYKTKLTAEINSKDSKLKNYNLMLQNQLDELNKINEKINLKLDLAKKEQDFTVREKYIYDIKTLENEKIDLISKIKENEVQIEFINYEIAQLNNRITIIANSQYELENTLSYNPGLDLSKTKNEIELLKTHISQNDLKQLAYKQDEILSDTKYYSQEIDLDAILYAGPDLADSELEEILIDTKSYTDKYSDILSANTLQTGDLVFKNDSLKEIIKNLEIQFDSTTNNNEKQSIIAEINNIKSEILSNNNIITDYLNSQTPVNLNQYLTEFESLKVVLQNTNYQNEIVETENLISESKNLENDIKDLIVLGADQDNPPILYLEGMKSEIDNLIIQKIETMKAGEIIANTDSDQIIIKDLNYRINEISNNNIQEPINKITENFNRVELLYQDADKENDKFKKNEIITNANNILDLSVGENTQFINDQLLRNYEILGTYKNAFGDLSKKPTKTDEIISKIETLEQEAANLQLNAEDSQDELEKMKILAQAWDKLMVANQYYEYVFDIIEDEKNYKRNFEPTINPETKNLISQTTKIEIKELVDITDADLADNNSTNLINENETSTNQNNQNNEIETTNNNSETNQADNNTEISDTVINSENQNILITENTDSITNNNVDSNIAENNNSNDNIDSQNQNTEIQQTGDLSDLTKKLDTVNYSGNIRISIKQQSIQKDEITKLEEEINKIKSDIENNTNNNKVEKLNQDLVNAQEKQIDGIIEYSITTNELLTELDSINSKISTNINNPQLDSLLRIQNEYRTSVIGYSNFYTADELLEKHLDAVAIENQIIDIYNSAINNADKDILANALNNNNEISSSTNNNTNSNNEIDFSNKNAYTYDYNADIQTVKTLEKLENNIVVIESDIKTQENILADIEARMEYSNSSSEYKKLQKELEKENKKYLKQLKLWATNNKDYLSLKNNLADDYYYNSKSTSVKAAIVGDSLKSESETNINESIALFEIIITSTSKIADKNIVETYKKAERLSIEGLNMLNAANYLKNDGTENDPLIIAHYRTQETDNQSQIADNNNQISSPTDTITATEIIANTDNNTENALLSQNENIEPADSSSNNIEKDIAENTNNNENTTINETENNTEIDTNTENENNLLADNNNTEPTDTINKIVENEIVDNATENDNINTTDTITETEIIITETDLISENTTQIDETDNNDTDTNFVTENTNETAEVRTEINSELDLTNIFDANERAFYSATNPIPGIPESNGLFYRIQIAAFNGKVNDDRFIGMKPIFWEPVPNSALIRYIVGNFAKYNSAINNLPTVRAMGYADAFIVAYYNGKRIPIYEARRIEEQESVISQEDLIAENTNTVNNTDTQENNDNTNEIINENEQESDNNATVNTELNNEETATIITEETKENTSDLTKSTGIFFTVQIGVYATQVGSDRLFGLNPIMYHNYTGNLVRHTFGKYYDLNTAINEQNKIRRLGIPDAFVVAYRDGEKINLNEARNLIANLAQAPEDEITLNIPEDEIPEVPPVIEERPVRNEQPNNDATIAETAPPVIEYYIQIGVFRNDVNNFIRDSFRRIAGDSQLVRLTNNDLTIYRIGIFGSYNAAIAKLNEVNNSGITDAFIVAYVNGKRIDVAKARILENN